MGYLKDLGTSRIAKFHKDWKIPVDQYGLLLNPVNPASGVQEDCTPGNEIYNLTSPYGHLHFAVGTGDDFVCFDYGAVIVPDDAPSGPGAVWALHATVNSETASYIDRFDYQTIFVGLDDPAPGIAAVLSAAWDQVDQAVNWCCAEGMRRMTYAGWNQKPCYYINSVACCLFDSYTPAIMKLLGRNPKPLISEKMLRFGSKRMEQFVQTLLGLG